MTGEESLRLGDRILDTSPDHISLVGRDYRYRRVNATYAEAHGIPAGRIAGMHVAELLGPDVFERLVKPNLDRCLSGEDVRYEAWFTFREGGRRYMAVRYLPLQAESGAVDGVIVLSQDITEGKLAEERLRRSETRFRTLFESMNVVALVMDPEDGAILDANAAAAAYYGWTREQLRGMKISAINTLPPDEIRARMSAVRERRAESFVMRHQRSDGSVRDVEVHSGPIEFDGRTALCSVIHDVTERKRAEEALKESEDRFRTAFQTSPDAININRLADGMYVSINRGFTQVMGYPEADVIGKTSLEMNVWVDPGDRERLVDGLRGRGAVRDLEARFRTKSGAVVHGLMSASVIDIAGVPHILSVTRDITERKQAEEALQRSEQMLKTIIEAEPECVKLLDSEARLIMMNRSGLDMIQAATLEQVQGQCVCPLVTDEHREAFMDLTGRVFQGQSGTLAFEMTGLGGRRLWLETHAVPLRDEHNEIVALLGVTRDITQRKADLDALREQRERLDLALQSAHMGVWRWEIEEDRRHFDDVTCELLGIDAAGFGGRAGEFFAVVHPEDREGLRRALRRTLDEGVLYEPEYRVVWPDGSTHHIAARGRLIRDTAGRPVRINGILWDVSAQKEASEALRDSERRFRMLIEHAASGIVVAERGTRRFLYANPVICRMFGYGREEFLALSLEQLHPAGEVPRAAAGFAGAEPMQTTCVRKDGTVFPVEITPVALELDGRPCLAGFFTDISDKRLLEEERLKAQKLESIGTLAGGIAHDFNNLLQGVFGHISMAKLTLDEKEKALDMLEQAERALHHSVALTSQLLTFSKGGKPVKKVIGLRQVIEDAVRFSLSGSRVDAVLDIDRDLRPVDADEGQIGQVIQNIVLNADQAMPEGGSVSIRARSSLGRPGFVEIVIRDSGVGIPPGYVGKIFDPYFTTKEKGSGLGLATSYSIVKKHGGDIDVRSEPGRGTEFTVFLPEAVVTQAAEPVAPGASAPLRRARVLVMDDEAVVRTVAGKLLESLGQEVDFAADGAEAVEKYRTARAEGRPCDAVILDLTVRGGMGGLEAMRHLQALDPGVKAVVSSGYSDDPGVAEYEHHGFRAFLRKPYDRKRLQEVLGTLLG